MTIMIGGVIPSKVNIVPRRLSMLIWGSAGNGKTTLAATAPGKKLLINFDPDGPSSLGDAPDVEVVDLSAMIFSTVEQFKNVDNPLGLKTAMADYDTFIFDSLTNATDKALSHGIATTKNSKIEKPAVASYQVRNALTLRLVKNVLALTRKHAKNCIFIAHEASPVTNSEGIVMHITTALGGQLPEQTALDISEVWYLSDHLGKKKIAFRPVRNRKPMKTRMFDTMGEPEFIWKFNPTTWNGPGMISKWLEEWKANEYKKIKPPANK